MVTPEILALIAAGGILLFGADKLPKLARSAGSIRKEFLIGQEEAKRLEQDIRS